MVPDQAVTLVGEEVNVEERRVVRVEVHHRAVHGDIMMVDPAAVGVKQEAEIGVPVGRVLTQFFLERFTRGWHTQRRALWSAGACSRFGPGSLLPDT